MVQAVNRREYLLSLHGLKDRLSRSFRDLVGFMDDLRSRDVGLCVNQQSLDINTPSCRAMLGFLGVFAEFAIATTRSGLITGQQRTRVSLRSDCPACVIGWVVHRQAC